MERKPPILPNHYYHIYNRGNNSTLIFYDDYDISHFIHLMKIFLAPVANVYSYAIMSNHLHIALRIKPDDEIGWLDPLNAISEDPEIKWRTTMEAPANMRIVARKPSPARMIQHLFSTHSKSLNARHQQTGNLMEDRFERKLVSSEDQLRRLICYINLNPEKHGVASFAEYQWTSYQYLVNDTSSWLEKDRVMRLFGEKEAFIQALKKTDFDNWLHDR